MWKSGKHRGGSVLSSISQAKLTFTDLKIFVFAPSSSACGAYGSPSSATAIQASHGSRTRLAARRISKGKTCRRSQSPESKAFAISISEQSPSVADHNGCHWKYAVRRNSWTSESCAYLERGGASDAFGPDNQRPINAGRLPRRWRCSDEFVQHCIAASAMVRGLECLSARASGFQVSSIRAVPFFSRLITCSLSLHNILGSILARMRRPRTDCCRPCMASR